jgi:hypothetical protein
VCHAPGSDGLFHHGSRCAMTISQGNTQMKTRSLLLVVATAALLNGKARAADILLDNTANLTAWNTNSQIVWFGNATPYNRLAGVSIVTGSTSYDLSTFSVAMSYGSGTQSLSPTMRLSVYENTLVSQTIPSDGAAVAYTQDFSSFTFTPTQQIYTMSPSATWNLKANTSYSFTLSTSDTTTATQLKWQWWSGTASSSYGFTQTSPFISADAGSTFIPVGIQQSPSMQLTGVVAVPEPSTCVSLLAGLACGGYSLFRRRRRA